MTDLLDLSSGNGEKMTSREIAEITGKRHSHIMDDCRKLNSFYAKDSRAEISAGVYKDANNQDRSQFLLSKRQSLDLCMGYSLELRIAVTDRWEELEKKTLPQSFSQALLLASQQAELIEQQEAKMKLDAPKVDYFDDLIDRDLYLSLRDTAKELNQKQKKFNQWLIDNGYIYRNPAGKIKPTAKAIEDGSIVLKEFKRKTSSFSGNQTLTTVKGRKTFLLLLEGVTL